MKCKICGVELKKEGEICNNCMRKIMIDQESKKDTQSEFVLKRKFAIGYEILSHIDAIGIAIFLVLILISLGEKTRKYGLLAILIFLLWGLLYLLYRSYIYKTTKWTFYKTKLVKEYRRLGKRKKEINYSEILDIRYEETQMQKIFNVGSLLIKVNKINLSKRYILIDSVKDIEKTSKEIKKLVKLR